MKPYLSALSKVLDVLDCVLDCDNLLSDVVRDLDVKFLLHSHNELDHIERVSIEIINKGRILCDSILVNTELVNDHSLDAVKKFFVCHKNVPPYDYV